MQIFLKLFILLTFLTSCSTLNVSSTKYRDLASETKKSCLQAVHNIYSDQKFHSIDDIKSFKGLSEIEKNEILKAIDEYSFKSFDETIHSLNELLKTNSLKSGKDAQARSLFSKLRGLFSSETDRDSVRKVKDFYKSYDGQYNYDFIAKAYSILGEKTKVQINGMKGMLKLSSEELQEIEDFPYVTIISKIEDGDNYNIEFETLQFKDLSDELLDSLGDSTLASKIQELKKAASVSDRVKKRVMQDVFERIIDKELAWFIRKRNEFDSISTIEELNQYISILSRSYQRLSAISPFEKNYQLLIKELFFSHFLEREGIPSSRITYFSDFNLQPQNDLEELVLNGIYSNHKLIEDLKLRVKLGLPLGGSPEWFSPLFERFFGLNYKKQGSQEIVSMYKVDEIDTKQFLYWYKRLLKEDPGVLARLKSSPRETLNEIRSKYISWSKKKRVVYDHKKEGEQEVAVSFVDEDFRKVFGKYFANNKEKFDAKRSLWYGDQTVWRGMSFTDRVVSEKEVLTMFKFVHHMLVSNKALGSWSRSGVKHSDGIKIINRQFDDYNTYLFNDNLKQIVTDHQQEGPLYWSSFGFSTSRDYKVGRAFAAGAMKVATYGEQYSEEVQKQLKSRVLVGLKRAKKDIELNKFRQVEPEFMSTYARQQEVVGVGGVDPDSVDAIHILGPNKGMAEFSYVRNPDKPNEIIKYKGLVNPEDIGNRDDLEIIETFDINNVEELN